MKIQTTRFGDITVDDDQIINFTSGILGFPDLLKYVILREGVDTPFFWLQSVEKSELAFVITNPLIFVPDYRIRIYREQLDDIKLEDLSRGEVWVLVSIRKNPLRVSINLQGPILVNKELLLAKQVVLNSDEYPLQYDIIKVMPHKEKVKA